MKKNENGLKKTIKKRFVQYLDIRIPVFVFFVMEIICE